MHSVMSIALEQPNYLLNDRSGSVGSRLMWSVMYAACWQGDSGCLIQHTLMPSSQVAGGHVQDSTIADKCSSTVAQDHLASCELDAIGCGIT